jgi:hypothetical protein
MKKLPKKSGLLLGTVLAVCAFAVPMASAASFSPVGTTVQLTSNDLQFSQPLAGGLTVGRSCAASQFDATVTSAALITISGGRFDNCRGTGIAAGCTVTSTGTRFPWSVTAPTTTGIQIHGFHVDIRYETAPGGSACSSLVHNTKWTWTGTLTGGVFDPSSTGTARRITFLNTSGLVTHSPIATAAPTSTTGNFRDPAGVFNLFD